MGGQEAFDLRGQGRECLNQLGVIYLDPSDTSGAIREHVRGADEKRLLLVVPKNCPGLDSLVDLKLLGRYVISLDKEVALVTRDRELARLARGLGFRTFSSVRRGQRARWKGRHTLADDSFGIQSSRGPVGKAIPARSRSQTVRLGEIAVFALAFLAMVVFMAFILVVLVPTATVTLEPVAYPVNTTLTVQASPDLESVDFINLRVPARVVEMELVGSEEIATTAIRDEPDALATGEVVFTNKRTQATIVLSDTIVSTSAGTTIRFRTTEPVTLPLGVGTRRRAPIEAIEPGPSGNVPAYSINRVEGPMDRQVNVINVAPTEEGGVSEARYVTNADKDQLRESSLHRLREEGYDALMVELTGEEFLPPESLVIFVLSETYDKFPDEVADSLGLHLRALIEGTVIDRTDVELLGLRMLQFEVREGFQLLPEETEFHIEEVSEVEYDGTLTFQMSAEGVTWVEIDVPDIREGIRGKSVSLAEEYLARHLSLVQEPLVRVSPEWWGRLPWLPFRIAIEVLSGGGAADEATSSRRTICV